MNCPEPPRDHYEAVEWLEGIAAWLSKQGMPTLAAEVERMARLVEEAM